MEQADVESARESAAARYEQSSEELELAVRHLRTAARHLREGEIPRSSAHAFAAYGHIIAGQRRLDENAVLHASRSNPG